MPRSPAHGRPTRWPRAPRPEARGGPAPTKSPRACRAGDSPRIAAHEGGEQCRWKRCVEVGADSDPSLRTTWPPGALYWRERHQSRARHAGFRDDDLLTLCRLFNQTRQPGFRLVHIYGLHRLAHGHSTYRLRSVLGLVKLVNHNSRDAIERADVGMIGR